MNKPKHLCGWGGQIVNYKILDLDEQKKLFLYEWMNDEHTGGG